MKLSVKKAVYLDLCALERPYNDQRYYRISIETTAVQLIVEQVKQGTYTQYYSPVHLSEIARDSSEMRRKDITLFLQSVGVYAKPFVGDSDRLEQRGWELHKLGFGIADALCRLCRTTRCGFHKLRRRLAEKGTETQN